MLLSSSVSHAGKMYYNFPLCVWILEGRIFISQNVLVLIFFLFLQLLCMDITWLFLIILKCLIFSWICNNKDMSGWRFWGGLVGFLVQVTYSVFPRKVVYFMDGTLCEWFVYFQIFWLSFVSVELLISYLLPPLSLREMAPSASLPLSQKQGLPRTALSFSGPFWGLFLWISR